MRRGLPTSLGSSAILTISLLMASRSTSFQSRVDNGLVEKQQPSRCHSAAVEITSLQLESEVVKTIIDGGNCAYHLV